VISIDSLLGGGQGSEGGPGLREVVERLTTPARAGFVLTKQQLATSAARLNLPVGFGERSQMLTNLFRAAAELDRLLPLIEALQAEARRWDSLYLEWAASYPGSAPIWQTWRDRLAASRALLDEMAQAAASVVHAEAPPADAPLPSPVDRQEEYAD
jgi:hypothetical protein